VECDSDERKNKENIRKHGFDFADAGEIFELPMFTDIDAREVTRGDRRDSEDDR